MEVDIPSVISEAYFSIIVLQIVTRFLKNQEAFATRHATRCVAELMEVGGVYVSSSEEELLHIFYAVADDDEPSN